jgi:hypothetical protein
MNFAIGHDRLSLLYVFNQLILKYAHKCDISSEIDSIASNLNQVSIEPLRRIGSSIFERIGSNESLRLENEESLLNILCSLGYFDLLGYVECFFLSVLAFELLLKSISISLLNSYVWSSICGGVRCKLDLSTMDLNESRFLLQFRFIDDTFPRILSHFISVSGGSVHSQGVVEIICSSISSNHSCQIADHGWTDYWKANNEANGWICFDFKEKRVAVQHCTLKSSGGDYYFTYWVIEGSNDSLTWIVLDDRHTDDLISKNIVKNICIFIL